ncbi:hypothetical protein V8E55_011854, partial [Tylopilus felleus]
KTEMPDFNNHVFARPIDSMEHPMLILITQLSHRDNVVVLTDPHEDKCSTNDTNPLRRTGTWSWMPLELVMAGPNQPVVHNELHDLELCFYVLVGISVLSDEPSKPKLDKELQKCFNKLFNTMQPSILKTITIQSNLTWVLSVLKHISPYF